MIDNQAVQAYLFALKCVADQSDLPETIHATLRELGVDELNIALSELYVPRQVMREGEPDNTLLLLPGYHRNPLRCLVAAENGSGKTTLLKMTAFEMIDRIKEFGVCPILLLPEQVNAYFAQKSGCTLIDIIADSMRALIQPELENQQILMSDLLDYLLPALSSGNILLLIDDVEKWDKEIVRIVDGALVENPEIHTIVTATSHAYSQLGNSLPGFAGLTPASFGPLPDASAFCKTLSTAVPQLKLSRRDFDLWFSVVCDLFSNCPLDTIWAVLSSGIFSDDSDQWHYNFDLATFLETLIRHRVIRAENQRRESGMTHGELFRKLQSCAYIAVHNNLIDPGDKMLVTNIDEQSALFWVSAGILSCEGYVRRSYYFSSPCWAWFLAAQYAVTHKKEGLELAKLALTEEEHFDGFIPLVISLDEHLGSIVLETVVKQAKADTEQAVELLEATVALCPFDALCNPVISQEILEIIFDSSHFAEYIGHIPRQVARLCLLQSWIPDDWIKSVLSLCSADRFGLAKEFLILIQHSGNYSENLKKEITQFLLSYTKPYRRTIEVVSSGPKDHSVGSFRKIVASAKSILTSIINRIHYDAIDFHGRKYYIAEDFTLGQFRFLALVGATDEYDFFVQKVIQKDKTEFLTKLDSDQEFDYVLSQLKVILDEEAVSGHMDHMKSHLASLVRESLLLRKI